MRAETQREVETVGILVARLRHALVALTGLGLVASLLVTMGPARAAGTPEPSAVQDLFVSQFENTVKVGWQAPVNEGASPILKYTVTVLSHPSLTATSAGCVAYPPNTSCLVEGLSSGTYVFEVVAGNSDGVGEAARSEPFVVTIDNSDVPGPPTGVSTTQNSSGVVVSWSPPASDGGQPILGYGVFAYFHPSGESANQDCGTGPDIYSCLITGLPGGQSYVFKVSAKNANGFSTEASSAPTLRWNSDPVTGVEATPGDTTATVSWHPLQDIHDDVAVYRVSVYNGEDLLPDLGCETTGPIAATTCQVEGLTNGQAYAFSVQATGSGFASVPSDLSAPVVPFGAPTAPVAVTGQQAGSDALVSWLSGAELNGAGLISFVATAYDATDSAAGTSCTTVEASCTVTGLALGETYRFRVTVTTTGGQDTSGFSDPVTLFADLNPVTAVTAVNNSATTSQVSWQLGAQPIPVDSFQAVALNDDGEPAGPSCTTTRSESAPPADSCEITGLTPGTRYTFRVVAEAAAGHSAMSVPSAPLVAGTPRAATDVTATQTAPGSVRVSWSAPAGGPTAELSYDVVAVGADSDPLGPVCPTSSGLDCQLDRLDYLTAYRFVVTASNQAGSGPPSEPSAPITPGVPPGQVTSVTATSDGFTATVSWQAVTEPAPATGYRVVTTGPYAPPVSCDVATTSCRIEGLYNAHFTFQVIAYNASGDAPISPSSNVVAVGAPDVVRNIRGSWTGGSNVTVSWDPPAHSGRYSPVDYRVTAATDGQPDRTCTSDNDNTSCQLSGMTPGTDYSITVIAHTDYGGDSLPVSAQYTPGLPGKPGIGPAFERSPTLALLYWTAPTDNDGASITEYAVEITADSVTQPTPRTLAAGDEWSYLSELTPGVKYSFRLAARTQYGQGQYSERSNELTLGLPSAPTVISARPGNKRVFVDYTPATDANGGTISYYEVSAYAADELVSTCTRIAVASSGCWVPNLTNGVAYTFRAVTVSNYGRSSASESFGPATPSPPPSAPVSFVATPGSRHVVLTWQPPTDPGLYPVQSYVVTSSSGAGCTITELPLATSCTITELADGVGYQYWVVAVNSYGEQGSSAQSALVTPTSVPSRPLGAAAETGTQRVTLTWDPPEYLGGLPVSAYVVTTYQGNELVESTGCLNTGAEPSRYCRIDGLANGVEYTFKLVARNATGDSPATAITATPIAGVPSSVLDVQATTGLSGQLLVSWTAPLSTGIGPLTSYVASAYLANAMPTPDMAGTVAGQCVADELPLATSCRINGLTDTTQYRVIVRAVNQAGEGYDSLPTAAIAPRDLLARLDVSEPYGDPKIFAYTVPDGVSKVGFELHGSMGHPNVYPGHGEAGPVIPIRGGDGAQVNATKEVTPDQQFQITLGNYGVSRAVENLPNFPHIAGFNGGGLAPMPGGGASDIRVGSCVATLSCQLAERVLVAGGGGGGGNTTPGGSGGYPAGADGVPTSGNQAGKGATATGGGAGGIDIDPAGNGSAGTLGQGGSSPQISGPYARTGAGGGGYFGGGSGARHNPGGGGSSHADFSFFPDATFPTPVNGQFAGYVRIDAYGPPQVESRRAGDITDTTATLRADVSPYHLLTKVTFRYSEDPTVPDGPATRQVITTADGTTEQNVSVGVVSLKPETTYYYKVLVDNEQSSALTQTLGQTSQVRSFTTSSTPPAPGDPSDPGPSDPGSSDPGPADPGSSGPGQAPGNTATSPASVTAEFIDTPETVLKGKAAKLTLRVASTGQASPNGSAVIQSDGQPICQVVIVRGRGGCESPVLRKIGAHKFTAVVTVPAIGSARAVTRTRVSRVTVDKAPVSVGYCSAKVKLVGSTYGRSQHVTLLRKSGSKWVRVGTLYSKSGKWSRQQVLMRAATYFKARSAGNSSQTIKVRIVDGKKPGKRGC